MKMELTDCSEMLAHTIQTPGNHPKERIQQNIFLLILMMVCLHYKINLILPIKFMHCWVSLVVSLDDGSLAELWLRSLSATFVAGRKMTCYRIFSILIAANMVSHTS